MKNNNEGTVGYIAIIVAVILTFLFIVSCEGTHEICGEYQGYENGHVLLKVSMETGHVSEVPMFENTLNKDIEIGDYICIEF